MLENEEEKTADFMYASFGWQQLSSAMVCSFSFSSTTTSKKSLAKGGGRSAQLAAGVPACNHFLHEPD